MITPLSAQRSINSSSIHPLADILPSWLLPLTTCPQHFFWSHVGDSMKRQLCVSQKPPAKSWPCQHPRLWKNCPFVPSASYQTTAAAIACLCMAEVANHICYYAQLHVQFFSLTVKGFTSERLCYILCCIWIICAHTPQNPAQYMSHAPHWQYGNCEKICCRTNCLCRKQSQSVAAKLHKWFSHHF